MIRCRRALRSAAVATVLVLAASAAPAWAQTAPARVEPPPVLVTGDSLSHQAAEDIAGAFAALGYHDVRLAGYGGTTIDWATDRVLASDAPVVVFASGTFNTLGGWTETDETQALRAIGALEQRRCALWVSPAAAKYPDAIHTPHRPSQDTAEAIRRLTTGTRVQLVEWDLVAHALPEVHVADGVHLTDGGQATYAALIAGSVRHRCEQPDPTRSAPHAAYVSWATDALLGRAPAPDELAAWTDRLASGHPRIAFTRSLVASPEAGFRIGALHRPPLDREVAGARRTHWGRLVVAVDLLASIVSVAERPLVHSPEARAERVDVLHRHVLGRPADPTSLAGWAEALTADGELPLAALLAASDEAFARAQATRRAGSGQERSFPVRR